MGKTWEFEDQVKRLRADDKDSFFVALNRVTSQDNFRLALGAMEEFFDSWIASDRPAHFFLDAVDEARLTSSIALEQSLAHIAKALNIQVRNIIQDF